MMTEADPIVGNWYAHRDKGQTFEVVAIDEGSGAVEIQHFDGDVEEVSLESWYDLEIEPSEPPEDWTGAVDDVQRDDMGYSETEMAREDWSEPLREVKVGQGGAPPDDWAEGYPEEEPLEGEE